MASDAPVKFTEIKLHSATGDNDYDIRAGIVSVDYYEDLLKPGTTIILSYQDAGNANGQSVFDALPIESKVKISLNFEKKVLTLGKLMLIIICWLNRVEQKKIVRKKQSPYLLLLKIV